MSKATVLWRIDVSDLAIRHLRNVYPLLFVALILVTGLACLYILFFGLVPDIVFTETK